MNKVMRKEYFRTKYLILYYFSKRKFIFIYSVTFFFWRFFFVPWRRGRKLFKVIIWKDAYMINKISSAQPVINNKYFKH